VEREEGQKLSTIMDAEHDLNQERLFTLAARTGVSDRAQKSVMLIFEDVRRRANSRRA
jgi:hypothetical protein